MRRTKLMFAMALVSCCVLLLVGCGSKGGTQPEQKGQDEQTAQAEQPKGLADVVEYFKKQGFQVGEVETKAFEMLGAVDGFGIPVDGKLIELYLFDPETADEQTKKNLDDAHRIGKFSMSGFSFPVIMNGNIMLARYDEHPEKEKIVEAFRAFKN